MPVAVETVGSRQKLIRTGIFFTLINKQNRSAYQNLDGETMLADECRCIPLWARDVNGSHFSVKRVANCPIDEHKAAAIGALSEVA
jgi:hypothetical protein